MMAPTSKGNTLNMVQEVDVAELVAKGGHSFFGSVPWFSKKFGT